MKLEHVTNNVWYKIERPTTKVTIDVLRTAAGVATWSYVPWPTPQVALHRATENQIWRTKQPTDRAMSNATFEATNTPFLDAMVREVADMAAKGHRK